MYGFRIKSIANYYVLLLYSNDFSWHFKLVLFSSCHMTSLSYMSPSTLLKLYFIGTHLLVLETFVKLHVSLVYAGLVYFGSAGLRLFGDFLSLLPSAVHANTKKAGPLCLVPLIILSSHTSHLQAASFLIFFAVMSSYFKTCIC